MRVFKNKKPVKVSYITGFQIVGLCHDHSIQIVIIARQVNVNGIRIVLEDALLSFVLL